jgi:hypothetical protein
VIGEAFGDITDRVLERIDQIKVELQAIQRQQHYEQFRNDFQPQQQTAVPDDMANQWVDALTVKSFNEELKSTFPYIYRLIGEKSELGYEDLIDEESDEEDEDEVKEDSMFAEFEQQMDDITTFDYDVDEGRMSDIDIDLRMLANTGDEEDLIAALDGEMGPGVAEVLNDMMDDLKDELAVKGMNDVIRDDDKMIEILWDEIVNEYGGDDEYNDDGGETDDNYALASAGFGSDEDYESINNEELDGKYKDVDQDTGDRVIEWLEDWEGYLNDSDDFGLAGDVNDLSEKFYQGEIGFKAVEKFVLDIADAPNSPLRQDWEENFPPNKVKITQPDLFDGAAEDNGELSRMRELAGLQSAAQEQISNEEKIDWKSDDVETVKAMGQEFYIKDTPEGKLLLGDDVEGYFYTDHNGAEREGNITFVYNIDTGKFLEFPKDYSDFHGYLDDDEVKDYVKELVDEIKGKMGSNKEESKSDEKEKDDLPFEPDENPTDKDEFGNTIKHRARHLARKGMRSVIPKEVVEYVASMYDQGTGTFPKGEEGVKIAVEKKFGEQAGQFAGFVVEKLSAKTRMETMQSSDLDRVRQLAGL